MLDISLGLLIITFVVFMIVLMLLSKWLYQPLLRLMDDRRESIANDMKNADQNGQLISDLNLKATGLVDKAKAEAAKIREKALEGAKKDAESRILAKRKELESEYGVFLESLSKEKDELKNALLSQMPLFKESLKAKITQI
jgi:F-type H+-transporting ATPase subunit b